MPRTKKTVSPETSAAKPKRSAAKKKGIPAKSEKKQGSRPRLEKDESGRSTQLRNPQVRILEFLAKGPASRQTLATECKCSVTEMVGPVREGASPNKYTISLTEMKLVKQEKQDINDKDVIMVSLTALGTKKLAALKKAE